MAQLDPLHLRIFLSSPGDVAEERLIATHILKQYQDKPHARGKVSIEVVAWDDTHAPTPMLAGVTPQKSVNRLKGRPADCDLTIVILWGRLGTQLPADMVRADGSRYESGTVWEYEDAMQAGKPVWVYRRTEKPQVSVDDPKREEKYQQYQALSGFLSRLRNHDGSMNGGVNDYENTQHFQDYLDKHFETFVRDRLETVNGASHTDRARIDSIASSIGSVATKSSQVMRRDTIPHISSRFIGRDREQTELRNRVLKYSLVTVTGAPGIGKSRLMMQVARSLEPEFDAIWFVPLAQFQNLSAIPLRIANILGVKDQPGKDLVDLIGESLKRGRQLIILDNCEVVLHECAAVVKRLLALCGELHLVLTSRRDLGDKAEIGAEHVYLVPPLDLPDLEHLPDLNALADIDSVELLLERVQARAVDFQLTEDKAKAVAELCCGLDGIPLAVELIAAQMDILTVDAVLKRRTEWLDFSRGGGAQVDRQEATLRNTIRRSYDLLGHELSGKRLRDLFRCLSAFSGGWTIEAARRVCGEPNETSKDIEKLMQLLLRTSLIKTKKVAGEIRFRYLDSIREFALAELGKEGRDIELAVRHARWVMEFAEHWQPKLLTNEQAVAISVLIAEADNIRAAFAWALQQQDAEIALRVASALWRVMEIKGFYQDGELRLRMALGIPSAKKFPLLRSMALNGLSTLAYRQGDMETSKRCAEQSLTLERRYGTNRNELATALNNLGNVAVRYGKYVKALDLYTKSMKISQATKDERGVAVCLFNIGGLYKDMGKLDKAEAKVEASLKIFEKTGNLREAAFAFNSLGLIEQYRNQYEAASRYADRSLEIRENLGDRGGVARAMVTKASILIRKQDFDTALDLLAKSGNIFFLINDERGVVESLEQLASLASHQGLHVKAVVLYAAADGIRKKLRLPLSPLAQQACDGQMECARNILGERGFDEQWEKGRGMPPQEAFALGVN